MPSEELRGIVDVLSREAGTPVERLALARAMLVAGDLEGARSITEALTAKSEGGAEAWYLLGQLRGLTGDPTGAIKAWERVLTIAPAHRKAILGLAALRKDGGDLPGAVEAYVHGLAHHPADEFLAARLRALDPGHPWLLVAEGDAAALDGDPETATEYYQRAAEAEPADTRVLWRLAWAARRSGRGDWAVAAWRKAVKARPSLLDEVVATGRRVWAAAGGRAT